MKYLLMLLALVSCRLPAQQFTSHIRPISAATQHEMLSKGAYKDTCPVALGRLAEVTFSYYDFSGVPQDDGKLIVMDAVAENVVQIMQELYKVKFPINTSQPIEVYSGDDDLSMAANNSSSFNCRAVTNKPGVFSIHSYGLAIDINPVQNPYVGKFNLENSTSMVLPSAGVNYLNRANIRPGMLEPVVHIFRERGFSIWGGNWHDRSDWQHFQTSRVAAKLLAVMSVADAKQFFVLYTKDPQLFNAVPEYNEEFVELYKTSSSKFMRILKNNFTALNKMRYEEALKFFHEQFEK